MQAKDYLKNSDLVAGSRGYIDILVDLSNNYVNDATAQTAISDSIDALIDERNNVHTLLSDGITDVAPTLTPAAADNGGKARYIIRELIQNYEGNVPYGVGLIRDETLTSTPSSVKAAPTNPPILMGDFVNGTDLIVLTVGDRGDMLDFRAEVIKDLYAAWDAVEGL